MKVLIISRNAWDDTNSIGNTLSNFFEKMDDVEFANIYFRSGSPNNDICTHYYNVTEKDIIKNWFKPMHIGKSFEWKPKEYTNKQTKSAKNERKLISFIHKNDLKVAYKLSNYLWYTKKWINDKLKNFIKEYKPDVIFTFVKSSPQYYLTVRYLREAFDIPIFSWIADDEYTGLLKNSSKREIRNLEYILNESMVVCGCSQEICDYYNSTFNCKAVPLYKGCDLSEPLNNKINDPLKIVYAGNLLYGRLDVIKKISNTIEKLSYQKKHFSFDIYSNTLLSEEEINFFKMNTCTNYLGKQDYSIIKGELSKADIVLHVESFDNDEIMKTRYSFSTKIIDCLQSGSILLAVGPSEIASMKYVKRIPGAYVINELVMLENEMSKLFVDRESFSGRKKTIREFAIAYHDRKKNKEKIIKLLKLATKE